jgi:hypothetical protein
MKMKVYKIKNDENDLTYYGSTKQKLSLRMSLHRAMLKRYKEGKSNNFCSSYEVMQYENPQIILVEEIDCENKEQLRARERHYVENFDCVNKRVPGRTIKESHDIASKKYYRDNKELITKKKEEKITCECGCKSRRDDISHHRKSKKHIRLMKNLKIDSQINND